jgi:hypothetical protein
MGRNHDHIDVIISDVLMCQVPESRLAAEAVGPAAEMLAPAPLKPACLRSPDVLSTTCAASSSRRCCGSRDSASAAETPNRPASKASTSAAVVRISLWCMLACCRVIVLATRYDVLLYCRRRPSCFEKGDTAL